METNPALGGLTSPFMMSLQTDTFAISSDNVPL